MPVIPCVPSRSGLPTPPSPPPAARHRRRWSQIGSRSDRAMRQAGMPQAAGQAEAEQFLRSSVTLPDATPLERTMTESARDIYVTGLRNAHAMEVQARELMERQSERLDD